MIAPPARAPPCPFRPPLLRPLPRPEGRAPPANKSLAPGPGCFSRCDPCPSLRAPSDSRLRSAGSAPAGLGPARAEVRVWAHQSLPLQSLAKVPPPPSVQSRLLPWAGVWSCGQANLGGGHASPPAHGVASLPACASGVRSPWDGGSEELAVAERNFPFQVPLRSGRRVGGQDARPGGDAESTMAGTAADLGGALSPGPSGPRRPAPRRCEDAAPLPLAGGLSSPRLGCPLFLTRGFSVFPPAETEYPHPWAVVLGGLADPQHLLAHLRHWDELGYRAAQAEDERGGFPSAEGALAAPRGSRCGPAGTVRLLETSVRGPELTPARRRVCFGLRFLKI